MNPKILPFVLAIFILSIFLFPVENFNIRPPNRIIKKKVHFHNVPLSLEMGMVDRFFRIVKSTINRILYRLEDPEKILDQTIIDMQNDLIKIRQSYAEVTASNNKIHLKRKEAIETSQEWYKRAQLAMKNADEALAKEALTRRQVQLDRLDSIQKQLDLQSKALEKLKLSLSALEEKISEAKRQKEEFIARARAAKTSVKINDMLSSISTSSSMEAFERMKEKVESLEIQADVAQKLADSSIHYEGGDVEKRFKELDGSSKINEELELLKHGMSSTHSLPIQDAIILPEKL